VLKKTLLATALLVSAIGPISTAFASNANDDDRVSAAQLDRDQKAGQLPWWQNQTNGRGSFAYQPATKAHKN